MRSRLAIYLALTTGLLVSAPVSSEPITWVLKGVQLADGAPVTGSFIYDADTGQSSAIAITTGSTSTTTGTTYRAALSIGGQTVRVVEAEQADYTGERVLSLNLASPLSNFLRQTPITTQFSAEAVCTSAACDSESPQRAVVIGTLEALPTVRRLPSLFPVDDIDGSGDDELLIAGRAGFIVRDPVTGDVLDRDVSDEGRTPIDGTTVSDVNGNGTQDLAYLVYDQLASRPAVEVRDLRLGKRVRVVNFYRDHLAVALGIVPDRNGNQSEEAMVLAQRRSDARGRLLIRDLETRDALATLNLPANVAPLDLATAPDFSGNGAAEALVLAVRKSDARIFVLVWDTGAEGRLATIRLPNGHQPVGHAYLTGPGAVAAVAVLAIRNRDQRGRLIVYDALTGSLLWAATLPFERTAVSLQALTNSGGQTALAVLQSQDADLRPYVSVFDADTGLLARQLAFKAVPEYRALALGVLNDLSLDANNEPELAVWTIRFDPLTSNFTFRTPIRDAVSKELLQVLTFN